MHQLSTIRRTAGAAFALVAAATVASAAHAETGIASYYNGRHPHAGAMTCAHKTAPFGTHYQVTRLDGGGSTTCVVNDRGPYGKGFIIDLSIAAARQLGIIRSGITKVTIARI